MKLRYSHDFQDSVLYSLPFVLVYEGSMGELSAVSRWCQESIPGRYNVGVLFITDDNQLTRQSFHFANKRDAMWCRLSHDA